MVSLLDIAPVAEKVSIRGKELPVNGLSITELRDLIVSFPDVGALLAEGVNAGTLLMTAPRLVASAICLSLGFKGTPDEIASVLKWPAGDQVAVMNAVIKLTAPGGIGPFVELARTLASGAESLDVGDTKASGMSSRRASRGASVLATKPMT